MIKENQTLLNRLNVISVDEQYLSGSSWTNYFPAKSVMVLSVTTGVKVLFCT